MLECGGTVFDFGLESGLALCPFRLCLASLPLCIVFQR